MAEQLIEHLINYLKSVRATPGLPKMGRDELDDAITLLETSHKNPNKPHILFPYPGDSAFYTADTLRTTMNNFFDKYLSASQDQINLQKKYFQNFIQDSGLLEAPVKPTKRGG